MLTELDEGDEDRKAIMPSNLGKTPEAWRNHGITNPISACSLQTGDLKRLFRILNKRVFEFRDDVVMPQLSLMERETEEQLAQRKQRVFNSFITSVTNKTNAGVVLTANNEHIFDEQEMPTSIKSIFLSTKSVPATVYPAIPCFINTFLDFSQPPALNFTTLPTLATPNELQFDVQADNETWFLAAKSDLVEFFRDKKTSVNWIHQGGTYDALLFIFGLPFALWVSSLAGRLTAIDTLPSVIKTATYIYIFVFALNAFRLFFSYTRWVFPKVELETEHSSPFKHRGIWVLFLVPVIGAAIWDALKWFVGWG